jgi:hypothetical protein
MAQVDELKTLITAENRQFLATLNQSANAARNFGKNLSGSFMIARNALTGGIIGTAIISTLKKGYENIDKITASADKLRISAGNFQFLQYAAQRTDVEISSLETSLRRLSLNLSRSGSDKGVAEALQRLNLSAKELQSLGVDEALFRITSAMKEMSASDQIDIGTKLIGKNFQELTSLAAADIQKLKKDFQSIGGAIDTSGFEKLDTRVNNLSKRLNDFGSTLFQTFGDTALTVIEGIADGTERIIRGISDGASAFERLANKIAPFEGVNQVQALRSVSGYTASANNVVNQSSNILPNLNFSKITSAMNQFGNALVAVINTISPEFAISARASEMASNASFKTSRYLEELGDSSEAAASALKKIKTLDLKKALGLGEMEGQSYLGQILTPIKQVENKNFTDLANDIRDDIALGGDIQGARIQSGIATLQRWAADQVVQKGESKSGMINAVKFLAEATANVKPPQQEVAISLTYDQDGIIKAFVSSPKMASITSQIVHDVAAKEAQSTIASGG